MATSNPFYTHSSGLPANSTKALSSQVRAELDGVALGFTAVFGYAANFTGQVWSGTQDFTGSVLRAATQAPGNNSTLVATTAFVIAQGLSSALPGQSGNAGKFITTDGTNASWSNVTLGISASITTPVITGTKEVAVALGAGTAIDCATGNLFSKTITGNTTLTVANVPASGTLFTMLMDITNGGIGTITWWSGVKWAAGAAPVLSTSGIDSLGFYTYDGGTTWKGLLLGKAFA